MACGATRNPSHIWRLYDSLHTEILRQKLSSSIRMSGSGHRWRLFRVGTLARICAGITFRVHTLVVGPRIRTSGAQASSTRHPAANRLAGVRSWHLGAALFGYGPKIVASRSRVSNARTLPITDARFSHRGARRLTSCRPSIRDRHRTVETDLKGPPSPVSRPAFPERSNLSHRAARAADA